MGSKIGLYTIYKSENGYNRKTATWYTSSEPKFVLFELLLNNYCAVMIEDKKSLEKQTNYTYQLLTVERVELYKLGITTASDIHSILKYNSSFKYEAEDVKMDGISREDKRDMMNEIWKELDVAEINTSIYDLAVNQKMSIYTKGESGAHSFLHNEAIKDVINSEFCTGIAGIYDETYDLGYISSIDDLRKELHRYAKEVLHPIEDYIGVMSSSINQIKDILNEGNEKEFLKKVKLIIDLPKNFLEEDKDGVQE